MVLGVMWNQWQLVFRNVLGPAERSYVSELRDVRNRWAHQQSFSSDDAYRALDTAQRLLTAVSAPQSAEIERMSRCNEKRKSAGGLIESVAAGALKPWREVITPVQGLRPAQLPAPADR